MQWFVKQIGLKLAELLLEKLQSAVISVYRDQLIKRAEEEGSRYDQRRATIVKSISRATTNEERRILSVMLSEL